MRSAVVTLSMAVMALGILFIGSGNAKARTADHRSHTGTFVSASDGKLVMTGRNGKEHTHAVAKDVKITIDGKAGAITGLKKGMHVSVTTDKMGNVMAITTLAAQGGSAATTAKPANPGPGTAPAAAHPASGTPALTPAKTTGK